jgi:hypothetical protein
MPTGGHQLRWWGEPLAPPLFMWGAPFINLVKGCCCNCTPLCSRASVRRRPLRSHSLVEPPEQVKRGCSNNKNKTQENKTNKQTKTKQNKTRTQHAAHTHTHSHTHTHTLPLGPAPHSSCSLLGWRANRERRRSWQDFKLPSTTTTTGFGAQLL